MEQYAKKIAFHYLKLAHFKMKLNLLKNRTKHLIKQINTTQQWDLTKKLNKSVKNKT